METLDSVTCSNSYTAAAQILDVFNSNGGYFVVTTNDVFMQLQYGGYGQTFETREVHVPVGNGVLQPGTTGIKFRNYVAGSNAIVSAALSEEAEPSIVLTAGGQAGAVTISTVTGIVAANGSITAGTGFTVNKTGTGQYTVSFSPALAAVPVVVADITVSSTLRTLIMGSITASSFLVVTRDSADNVADSSFNFLAYPVS